MFWGPWSQKDGISGTPHVYGHLFIHSSSHPQTHISGTQCLLSRKPCFNFSKEQIFGLVLVCGGPDKPWWGVGEGILRIYIPNNFHQISLFYFVFHPQLVDAGTGCVDWAILRNDLGRYLSPLLAFLAFREPANPPILLNIFQIHPYCDMYQNLIFMAK